MYYVEHKTWAEIAAALGVSTSYIRTMRQSQTWKIAEQKFRDERVDSIHAALVNAGETAVATLLEVCGDKDAAPQARVAAARAILERVVAQKIEAAGDPDAASHYRTLMLAAKQMIAEGNGLGDAN